MTIDNLKPAPGFVFVQIRALLFCSILIIMHKSLFFVLQKGLRGCMH